MLRRRQPCSKSQSTAYPLRGGASQLRTQFVHVTPTLVEIEEYQLIKTLNRERRAYSHKHVIQKDKGLEMYWMSTIRVTVRG